MKQETSPNFNLKQLATSRGPRTIEVPRDSKGKRLKVTDYFGDNQFVFDSTKYLPSDAKYSTPREITKSVTKDIAKKIAKDVLEWATDKGVTHFCHWFQPLTGSTAEKHDAFLSYDDDEKPIEYLSGSQLMQGEPDASSFPHGGTRSTFEARGYTTWDITSPLFIREGVNGKTLCIPTAFVSYYGDALDIKTPLLRSVSKLSTAATEFLQLTGQKDVKSVKVTCGAEQEYFLVDKAFFYNRPDMVMTGRTLLGSMTSRNQQLEDHYFGTVPSRVLSFMQELEVELYKIGIPAKTRHNEVAPGQFEIAQIFRDANVSADNNQMVMALIEEVADRHSFKALIHEKPFAEINGNGKHLNWSMSDNKGRNLLEPGSGPENNYRFLAVTAIIVEAVKRHAELLRVAIASHGNDHRLGANEAPPSIISVFLGDTLDKIFSALKEGKTFSPDDKTGLLDIGADQLVNLFKDNTDRNRTSPFAFTGNKFEFRAVGGSSSIGWPLAILNAAVADVFEEANAKLKAEIDGGKKVNEALLSLSKSYISDAWDVVFNGDGYSQEWVDEAAKRGLPNLRTTPDALEVLKDESKTSFLERLGVLNRNEIKMRYNVLLERYITHREIEFNSLKGLIERYVIPSAVEYKAVLTEVAAGQREIGIEAGAEIDLIKKLNFCTERLYSGVNGLAAKIEDLHKLEPSAQAKKIADELMPLSEEIAENSNKLEELVPADTWILPTYYDLLFVR